MAEYNLDNPILFVKGLVTSFSISSRYAYDDNTGLGPSGSNIGIEFDITVSNIDSQQIGSSETRSGGTRAYTGLDIKTGDWVSNAFGTVCLQVISISAKSETAITFKAKDVDAFSYKNYRSNTFTEDISEVAFFEVSDSGKPLIGGEDASTFFGDKVAIDQLQSRFALQEEDERFKIEFSSAQTSIEEGQVVTIDSNGDLVPFGTGGASDFKLGLVSGISYGDTIVYIKPFNTIIDNFTKPEKLTGSFGDFYYASTVTPGDITTNSAQGSDKLYFQFKDAVPTVVQATTANLATSTGDTLIVNGVTSVSGARTTSEIISDINNDTATHFVTATGPTTTVSAESYDAGQPSNADVFFVISSDSGSTYTYPTVTISDGTNSSTVTFNTSDGTFPGFAQYLTVSATQMASDLNTAFGVDGVDLTAEAFNSGNGNNPSTYPSLRITAGAGKSINITDGQSDAISQGFTAMNAFNASYSASTDVLITLTRADGGDILLTGGGSFVNSGGIVSSSAGSPALLVMVEDEEGSGGVSSEGVSTNDDYNLNPSVTSSDGDTTGLTISNTPHNDSHVRVMVNGIEVGLGGNKLLTCYFSADGGTTARAIADITSGDTLYWNGSVAGYQLDANDKINIIYEKTA